MECSNTSTAGFASTATLEEWGSQILGARVSHSRTNLDTILLTTTGMHLLQERRRSIDHDANLNRMSWWNRKLTYLLPISCYPRFAFERKLQKARVDWVQ